MGITITTAQQGMGNQFANGARSWDAGLTSMQRAQLRAIEQGSGANLEAYGSLNPNSITAQKRAALGAPAPTVATANGMQANGQMATQPTRAPAVQPGQTPLNQQQPRQVATGQQPAGQQPVTTAVQPGQQQFIHGSTTNPAATSGPAGTGYNSGIFPTYGNAESPNLSVAERSDEYIPAGILNMTPQQGGFIYTGVGEEGKAVFRDPTTGEKFELPGEAGREYRVGQGYAIPSSSPKTGLIGSEEALQGALTGGLNVLQQGNQQGRDDLINAGTGANARLNGFYDPGVRSNDYQAALSGALGEDAQRQAMDSYQSSPGFQYMLDESERAIRRNAAATGGLGGGNVQRALQENAIGLAAQDFDNNFNRLSTVSDRGLNAGTTMSGNTIATGNSLANLTANNANAAANMIAGTGDATAAGRTRAGEMLAGNVDSTTNNLSGLTYQTGQDIADVIRANSGQLASLLAGSGRDSQAATAQLATILANLSSGSASNIAGLPNLGTTQQTTGALSDVLDIVGLF